MNTCLFLGLFHVLFEISYWHFLHLPHSSGDHHLVVEQCCNSFPVVLLSCRTWRVCRHVLLLDIANCLPRHAKTMLCMGSRIFRLLLTEYLSLTTAHTHWRWIHDEKRINLAIEPDRRTQESSSCNMLSCRRTMICPWQLGFPIGILHMKVY